MEEKEINGSVGNGAEQQSGAEPPESSEAPAAGEDFAKEGIDPGQLLFEEKTSGAEAEAERLRAMVEAAVYITDEPLTAKQIAAALEEPPENVERALEELSAEYEKPIHGLTIRQLAEGYKMGTKAEHHESIRSFVKKLQKPLKLSMAALETLAVVAYKQPITAPEILDIRGVQGAVVLKTLLDRKLITTAGRKDVVGKPILYKTTKDFLVQFGLKNVKELPTLKEFEELARVALADSGELEPEAPEETPADEASAADGKTEEPTPETGQPDDSEASGKEREDPARE